MTELRDIKIVLDDEAKEKITEFGLNVQRFLDAVGRLEVAMMQKRSIRMCRHCKIVSILDTAPVDCAASTNGHHWEPLR